MVATIERKTLTGKNTFENTFTTLVDQRERGLLSNPEFQPAAQGEVDDESLEEGEVSDNAIDELTDQISKTTLSWPKKREDREWTTRSAEQVTDASEADKDPFANFHKRSNAQSVTRGRRNRRGRGNHSNSKHEKKKNGPNASTSPVAPLKCVISPGWHRALRNLVIASSQDRPTIPRQISTRNSTEQERDTGDDDLCFATRRAPSSAPTVLTVPVQSSLRQMTLNSGKRVVSDFN